MPRRPPPTIGAVECGFCHELAAVREDKGGRRYYVCACMTQPVYHADYIAAHATIWGEGGEPPAGTPDWIARGLRFKPGSREGGDRPRTPAPPPDPAPADPEPDPEPEPEGLSGGLFL